VRRRDLIVLAAGAVALACTQAARAQQAGKVYRIGFLGDSPAAGGSELIEAFRQGLRDLGYAEGRNIAIEYRWAEGKPERMRELAEELVRLKVDVIITASSIYVEAAKRATSTIPIVFMAHADPVGTGHVTSLARPGGNITGFSVMATETSVKSLELFTQTVPGLARVAVIFDPAAPSHGPILKAVEAAGPLLGLQVQPVAVRSATEFDNAFSAIRLPHSITSSTRDRNDSGIVSPSALAVLRLTTSWNLVGCWTGRSAGSPPFRILST